MKLYPLKFKPVYQEKIWGGNRIKTHFQKDINQDNIGESWEISAHPNGISTVDNGTLKGTKLTELYSKYKKEIMGDTIKKHTYDKFPLLFKILDADKKLSVQVHPGDDYALKVEGEPGKTEMWYIIDAKPEAKLVYGLKPGTNKSQMKKAIKNGQLEKHLNRVNVKPGDTLFIPRGTIHALEEGILLAEIQQSSDTTYRVYDWDRLGQDGKPRELHVEKALDVTDFDRTYDREKNVTLTHRTKDFTRTFLAACSYFVTEKINLKTEYNIIPGQKRFYIIMALDGQSDIIYNQQSYSINPGDSFLFPATLDKIKIKGNSQLLKIYIPDSKKQFLEKLGTLDFKEKQIKKLPGIQNWQ
ncbi:MAG: type I phosphomannose isomerase catalytic subunit [Halanaerobiaceae bacterium]